MMSPISLHQEPGQHRPILLKGLPVSGRLDATDASPLKSEGVSGTEIGIRLSVYAPCVLPALLVAQ